MFRFAIISGILFTLVFPSQGRIYYVDPANGSMENDGSYDHPWSTLEEVIAANLIQSYSHTPLPYDPDNNTLAIKNENAPVKPGDTLVLRTGLHGNIFLRNYINPEFITIIAAEGQRPILEQVRLQACKNWRLENLVISSEPYGNYINHRLVYFESHNWHGPSSHIEIRNCEIYSTDYPWAKAEDWVEKSSDGIFMQGDSMLAQGNIIRNVDMGLTAQGNHITATDNTIENFSGDGMRMLGSHIEFERNVIMNCYDVDDNHDDGIQSFVTDTSVFRSNIIRSNIILNYVDPNQPLRGTLQGIGCFDGFYEGWIIENNVVSVDHWHGITLLGARDCRVINNTVVDPSPDIRPGGSWIMIGDHKDGQSSKNCVVANNVANAINADAELRNNVVLDDYEAYDSNFVNYNAFDFHLKDGSTLIDAGSTESAPNTDIEGVLRPQGMSADIGAYEYSVKTSYIEGTRQKGINIFPNPTSGNLYIQNIKKMGIIEIFDVHGQLLKHSRAEKPYHEMDLHDLQMGMYFITISGGGGKSLYTNRFIKF